MKRLFALLTVATLMVALLLPAAVAMAQEEEEAVTVEIGPTAKLLNGGQAVRVKVKVSCEPVGDVLEALLFVEQEDAYGEGFLSNVVCDGRTHVTRAEVEALDGTFHPGKASVSAFVLLEDPETGETTQGQDSRVVRVVGEPH